MGQDVDLAFALSAADSDSKPIIQPSEVSVWDTEYCAPSKIFSAFREGLCAGFMPWTPELRHEREFNARIESVSLKRGVISRIKTTPHTTSRTARDVANSDSPCIYAAFLLGGSICLEQDGTSAAANQGDLALFTSEKPIFVTEDPKHNHQALVLMIPPQAIPQIANCADSFTSVVLPKDKIISPPAACAALSMSALGVCAGWNFLR